MEGEGEERSSKRVQEVDHVVGDNAFAFEDGAKDGVEEIAERSGEEDEDEMPGCCGCGKDKGGRDDERSCDADECSFEADDAVETALAGPSGKQVVEAAAIDHSQFGGECIGGGRGKACSHHQPKERFVFGEQEGADACEGGDPGIGDHLARGSGRFMGGIAFEAQLFFFFPGGGGGAEEEEQRE